MAATTLIPCRGGPGGAGWLRVPDPPPLEVRRPGGTFVLGEESRADRRYVFVEESWAALDEPP